MRIYQVRTVVVSGSRPNYGKTSAGLGASLLAMYERQCDFKDDTRTDDPKFRRRANCGSRTSALAHAVPGRTRSRRRGEGSGRRKVLLVTGCLVT